MNTDDDIFKSIQPSSSRLIYEYAKLETGAERQQQHHHHTKKQELRQQRVKTARD